MSRDHDHNPDPNTNAARIIAESTANIGPQSAAPASVAQIQAHAKQAAAQLEAGRDDLETTWAVWSAGTQKVDKRGTTQLGRLNLDVGIALNKGRRLNAPEAMDGSRTRRLLYLLCSAGVVCAESLTG